MCFTSYDKGWWKNIYDPMGMGYMGGKKKTIQKKNAKADAERAAQERIAEPSKDLTAATDAAAERAALANDKRKASLARSRTVYTSPLGVSAQASTARKTLTGQ